MKKLLIIILLGFSLGLSAQRIESSAGGNTNIVYVVKDDVTATPTTTIGTVTENTAGTKRYVSGVPYYNTGSPDLQVAGTTVANFTGQAYQDAVDRLLGETVDFRFLVAEKKGIFSRIFGG